MNSIRDRVQKLEALTNVVSLIDACGVTEAELPGIIENAVKEMKASGEEATSEAPQDLQRYLEQERSRHTYAGRSPEET